MRCLALEGALCSLMGVAMATSGRSRLSIRGEKRFASALVVDDSLQWDGNDGPWTSFKIQMGTKPQTQDIRVFPSTSLGQIWLMPPMNCPNDTAEKIINGRLCADSRGGLYDSKASNSSELLSVYNVGVFSVFSYFGFENMKAQFGWDDISFGYQTSSGRASSTAHALVTEVSDFNYTWLGMLGIDPKPTYFANMSGDNKQGQFSLLEKLVDSDTIPSRSWAYTAGSKYYGQGIPGSLILGGYDANRFYRNDVEFKYNEDDERPFTVAIQDVFLSPRASSGYSSIFNGDESIWAPIDSNRPYIYLPPSTCDIIAQRLNLTYDSQSDHYLIAKSTHRKLGYEKPSLTLQIGPDSSGDQSVSITLPYSSLSLSLGFPHLSIGNESHYFPIKRAINPKQYVLGRAFLQNAYLIADYERRSFSVHDVRFLESGTNPLIRQILPEKIGKSSNTLDSWRQNSNSMSTSLSKGATTGITVGTTVFVFLIGIIVRLVLLFRRSRRRQIEAERERKESDEADEAALAAKIEKISSELPSPSTTTQEIDSGIEKVEMETKSLPVEMPDENGALAGFFNGAELDSKPHADFHEMEGSSVHSNNGTPSSYGSGDSAFAHGDVNEISTIPELLSKAPASSIPKTPLEYYGHVPPWSSDAQDESRDRNWSGSAPGVPDVTLIPPSPTKVLNSAEDEEMLQTKI